jgi:hypothetical protein
MIPGERLRDRIDRDGFAVVPGVLSPETVDRLRSALATEAVLGPGGSAVQALFLDKPPDANWKIC